MPKYLIKAKVAVEGIVEKSDVIGAIFGQTEGLLGEHFDLRQLQDKGRLGRIIVDLKTLGNKTEGEVIIPSNLDRVETALVAAMIETVDKVGPYNAKIRVVDIVDVRLEKIKKIVERAKEILKIWSQRKSPDLKEILQEIESVLKPPELIKYGPEQLPAGPDVEKSSELIIVEGRADVINMLRYGYKNVIALGGAKPEIPRTLVELAKKKKKVIVFLDGDHGGDLILKELLKSNLKIDLVARAPQGKEVEELTGKEIKEALSKAISVQELKKPKKKIVEVKQVEKPVVKEVEEIMTIPAKIVNDIKSLYGTLESIIYNRDWEIIAKMPVRELVDKLKEANAGDIYAIVMDGIITQRLLDVASEKKIRIIIGTKLGSIVFKDPKMLILTYNDLL